jgi:hypothetical protein
MQKYVLLKGNFLLIDLEAAMISRKPVKKLL